MPAKGTRNAIFFVNAYVKVYRNAKDLHLCFIDYSKAFDEAKYVKLFRMLQKLDIDGKDLRVIRDLYRDQTASARTEGEHGDFKFSFHFHHNTTVISTNFTSSPHSPSSHFHHHDHLNHYHIHHHHHHHHNHSLLPHHHHHHHSHYHLTNTSIIITTITTFIILIIIPIIFFIGIIITISLIIIITITTSFIIASITISIIINLISQLHHHLHFYCQHHHHCDNDGHGRLSSIFLYVVNAWRCQAKQTYLPQIWVTFVSIQKGEGRLKAEPKEMEVEIRMESITKDTPQQGDLRLSGPPTGQSAGGGPQTRNRMVPADLRADSLATVPPMHQSIHLQNRCLAQPNSYAIFGK
ncbi:hypothetical protein PoB_007279400 [Plakobranchus ocellatus]|uniref:Reverse transcriptase domain-containing protein n=1 Tax=Plakobranchus ocellatus TaxID=259542 RepID=A0AAV4DQL1_9GAST|nr:hypothetical protein PoB_007279400 [Plakobranchus ocellatus]